jgi:prepilin-type N-terminal cleavage/methylation domain-containing protein
MKLHRSNNAFTLIELLVVIAIIGIMAAMVGPTLSNFRKGDALATGTSQLLGGVARARQLAISQRTDVYMIFLPTNFWTQMTAGQWNLLTPAEKIAITNLSDKQLTGYTFFSSRVVGDQPGQTSERYYSDWQVLPDGIFIPEEKFVMRRSDGKATYTIDDPAPPATPLKSYPIYGFTNCLVPFPKESSAVRIWLPCMVFNYQGRLISQPPSQDGENIPLAHGSVFYPRNPTNKVIVLGTADAEERPAGSGSISYNIVHVDWLTGRGHLERKENQ